MLTRSSLFAIAAVLALAGCNDRKTQDPAPDADISVSVDDTTLDNTTLDENAVVDIQGNTDTGKVEIRLPGGVSANVNVPGGITDKAKFDIGGVGLYPGAKLGSVNVNAQRRQADSGKTHAATVKLGFTAPADAAAVADWYQQQFEAKKISVRRSGETLTGKTDDGDDFTLAVAPAANGAAGMLTIIDTN